MRRHRAIPTREFRVVQPLRSCIDQITTRCSLACCGIHACKITPLMLELWSDSVGKEKTRSAVAQALEIVRLCDDSGGQTISCGLLNYQELHEPPTPGGAERTEAEKVQDENRQRLRDFFASVAEGLRVHT